MIMPPRHIPCLAVIFLSAAPTHADHLKCYKIKDSAPKTSYTADLTGLAPETGCTIKVPGRLLCVDAPNAPSPICC